MVHISAGTTFPHLLLCTTQLLYALLWRCLPLLLLLLVLPIYQASTGCGVSWWCDTTHAAEGTAAVSQAACAHIYTHVDGIASSILPMVPASACYCACLSCCCLCLHGCQCPYECIQLQQAVGRQAGADGRHQGGQPLLGAGAGGGGVPGRLVVSEGLWSEQGTAVRWAGVHTDIRCVASRQAGSDWGMQGPAWHR